MPTEMDLLKDSIPLDEAPLCSIDAIPPGGLYVVLWSDRVYVSRIPLRKDIPVRPKATSAP